MEDNEDVTGAVTMGEGAGSDSGLRLVHGSMELCGAAKPAISPPRGQGRTRSRAPDRRRHRCSISTWETVIGSKTRRRTLGRRCIAAMSSP